MTKMISTPERLKSKQPNRFQMPSISWLIVIAIILGFFARGVYSAEMTPGRIISGIGNIGEFIAEAVPPDLTRFENYFWAIVETFEMALVGTVAGVILSLPVALLASDNTTPNQVVRLVTRNLVAAVRTIPELVWALIFVIAIGLGPAAGIFTLTIDTIGFCGRFFSERIEEIPPGPVDALRATGSSQLGITLGAIFPVAFPSMVATSLYALEKAIRSAVILGIVGAGGIGVELETAMTMFRYDEALTIIILIWLVVLGSEQFSTIVRRRVI